MKLKKAVPAGKQGFTLIELLIVIAIIGILASIIFVKLSLGRQSAKDVSALSSLSSVVPAALICSNLEPKPASLNNPNGFNRICTASPDPSVVDYYPKLSVHNWKYADFTGPGGGFGGCTGEYNLSDGKFTICAVYPSGSGDPTKFIRCTENGCSRYGF